MRILHVYSGNLYGGVETFLVTAAKYRGLCPAMEPHFALCFSGRLSRELQAVGAVTHDLGAVRVSRPLSVWRARQRLKTLLQEHRYDAAVCHAPWSQAIFGPVLRSAGVRHFFWQHDIATGRHWLERWASLTPPDRAVSNSEYSLRSLPRLFPRVPAHLVRYPVPLENQSPSVDRAAIRREFETPADSAVIIQVSRLERWKGHTLHLDGLAGLRDLPGWTCWIVGGPQRPHEHVYYA